MPGHLPAVHLVSRRVKEFGSLFASDTPKFLHSAQDPRAGRRCGSAESGSAGELLADVVQLSVLSSYQPLRLFAQLLDVVG